MAYRRSGQHLIRLRRGRGQLSQALHRPNRQGRWRTTPWPQSGIGPRGNRSSSRHHTPSPQGSRRTSKKRSSICRRTGSPSRRSRSRLSQHRRALVDKGCTPASWPRTTGHRGRLSARSRPQGRALWRVQPSRPRGHRSSQPDTRLCRPGCPGRSSSREGTQRQPLSWSPGMSSLAGTGRK
jgi:hypothetical protein